MRQSLLLILVGMDISMLRARSGVRQFLIFFSKSVAYIAAMRVSVGLLVLCILDRLSVPRSWYLGC
jgi:hypothetical protein